MKIVETNQPRSLPVLVAGDIAALLLFVMVGLASHQKTSSLLFNFARVGAPFLLGWFAVAPFTGAYRLPIKERGVFLRRSALTWLLGVSLGLLLRATLFRDGVVATFAAITLIATGIFVLGWRAVYAIFLNRYSASDSPA